MKNEVYQPTATDNLTGDDDDVTTKGRYYPQMVLFNMFYEVKQCEGTCQLVTKPQTAKTMNSGIKKFQKNARFPINNSINFICG